MLVASLPFLALTALVGGRIDQEPEVLTVNERVVAFVMAHEGKKVGRGECWDLAAEALNSAGADWDGSYGFGALVAWREDEVLPGDIVQFENVRVEHRTENAIHTERYTKHTAVVVAVHGRGEFTIAHQNVGDRGRKVGRSELHMRDVRAGKIMFHRPGRADVHE
ncbi:MAG: CHAP domain-containing protein [Flavobacteriales bacterium]